MRNLYWIKDKKGNTIRFVPNWAQELLLKDLWFFNVILKARQLGITTFFCILFLDEAIFNGKDCGLIAHKLDAATKIFKSKVRFAWERLPEEVRSSYEVNTLTARELKFKHKETGLESSFYVGTSLRSGTVQRLHISELGTISEKYPMKAEEIVSGAFNTVEKGQIITVESTAKGQAGYFYDFCELAQKIQRMGGVKTQMDWKFFFFSWWKHPSYVLETPVVINTKMKEYFRKLEAEQGIKLKPEQKYWYIRKKDTQGSAMKREYPSTPEEAFEASIEGAYYSKQLVETEENGRIRTVPYEESIPVDTWWDIGTAKNRKDSGSIIFTQDIGMEIHVIDFYGNSGEGLPHYIKVLDKKGYKYGQHHAPHDISVIEFGTGKTRLETAAKLGINFVALPKLGVIDGIDATRMIFNKCWFDEEKTAELLKALRSYRKEWDDNLGRWKDNPHHDWASDPADAMRMMAIGHKDHIKLGDYDAEEEELLRIEEKEEKGYDPTNPFAM